MNVRESLLIVILYGRLAQLGLLGPEHLWQTACRFAFYPKRARRRITWEPMAGFLSKN